MTPDARDVFHEEKITVVGGGVPLKDKELCD